MMTRRRSYWYHQYFYECPVCGSGGVYRTRMYGRKPKDPAKRYEYEDHYDYCLE
jgi:hypothetical protein